MARTTTRAGVPPFLLISNVIIWISAVIVMGILSYFISVSNQYVSRHIIYEEVIVSSGPTLPEVYPGPHYHTSGRTTAY